MSSADPRDALAIAIGPVRTTALLIEPVDGVPRLAAVGRAASALFGAAPDASAGARAVLAQVEAAAGRPLFALGGVLTPRRIDGAGVDACTVVVEDRPTIVTVGFGDRPASSSVARALAGLDARSDDPILLRAPIDVAELADRLRARNPGRQPHALVVVGPADAPGLARLGDALQLAWPVAGTAPPLLWAGEAAGAPVARAVLAARFDLRVVEPVRPEPATEDLAPLRAAVIALWRERLDEATPGAGAAARWTPTPVQTWRRGEDLALAYLASRRRAPVWLARLAGHEMVLLYAEPGPAGRASTVAGARVALELPDRTLRPWTMPATPAAARALAQAAVEALRAAAASLPADARPVSARGTGLLVAGGDLALLGVDALTRGLVDGLEPTGLVQLALDETDGLAALGGLAELAPSMAAAVLDRDLLRPLGAVVAPGWRARRGAVAFRLRSAPGEAEGPAAPTTATAALGETRRVPLDEGERAILQVDRPGWWDPRRYLGRKLRLTVDGGPLGLLLDARPRPCTEALSLGRAPLEDDAPAPAALPGPVVARPIADGPHQIRRVRPLPAGARLLVAPGETVQPDELVAQAPGRGDGTQPTLVPAGRLLGVADPRPFLVRPPGSRVAAGEVIARRKLFLGLLQRTVASPIDGVLAAGLGGFGNLAVVPASDGLGIPAHLPGVVVGRFEGGLVVETRGALVAGALGFGGERRGALLPPVDRLEPTLDARTAGRLAGAVAVLDVLDRAQHDQLRAAGAAGAIVGSVDPALAAELAVVDSGLVIVATEGVGAAPLPTAARALLARHAGGLACLGGGRVDDPRSWPEAILPLPSGERARPAPEPTLAVGSQVRLVGDELGHGRVAAVLSAPARLPSGVLAAAADVELESGARVRAPVANLELIG